MKHIHPISEEKCREHYGKPVLVVLRDGSEIVGILSKYDQDKIILNGETPLETTDKKSKKISINKKKGRSQSKISAFPSPQPYPNYPYGGALVLDLAFIALLFALI